MKNKGLWAVTIALIVVAALIAGQIGYLSAQQPQQKLVRVHKTKAIELANKQIDGMIQRITYMRGVMDGWQQAVDTVLVPQEWTQVQ